MDVQRKRLIMPEIIKCNFIIKSGLRKNQICNKNNCKIHKQSNGLIQYLPIELQNLIISYVNNFHALQALSQSCKMFHNLLSSEYPEHYDKLRDYYENILNKDLHNYSTTTLSSYQLLSLYLDTGCQRCGQLKIRKVYPEYGLRICNICFEELTIRCYELKPYGIPVTILQNLPSVTVSAWSRRFGANSYQCYLLSDILQKIGCSLKEYEMFVFNETVNKFRREYPDIDETNFELKITFDMYRIYDFNLKLVKNTIWTHRCLKYIRQNYTDIDVPFLGSVSMISKMVKKTIESERVDEEEIDQILSNEKIRHRIITQATKKTK